ncbi:MAG: flippase-like domain-containing protein [Thermodesulfovibrionales bacterium]|nr:flippase-like domain-containing protein [Thermodesulfovibrionales bacterium]
MSVSSLLLYVLISKAGTKNLFALVKNINISFLFIASLIYILATYISSIRWKILSFSNLPVRRLFSLYMIGSFFNTILPGIIGGDAVKAYYLYRETGNPGISMASVFMDRYIGFISIMLIALVALPFGLTYIKETELWYLFPTLIIIFTVGSFVFFKVRIGESLKLLREFYSFFDTYRNLNRSMNILLKSLFLSAIIQLMNMAAVYIISHGLGIQVPFLSILIFLPLAVTLSMLPLSISGLGVREAAFVMLFGKAGVKPEAAIMLSLMWFFSVVIGSLPGLLFYLMNMNKKNEYKKIANQ